MARIDRTGKCKMRAKCGQAFWRGTAKLLIYLVDLIGIEPMTSSMPWKRAPNCATGPHGDSLIVAGARGIRQWNACPTSGQSHLKRTLAPGSNQILIVQVSWVIQVVERHNPARRNAH